jgi:electron transfer flavoprotein alpha subunit
MALNAEETSDTVVNVMIEDYSGVWVFVEHTHSEVEQVSWELLGIGAELARARGVELCSVVVGDRVERLCYESFAYGAKKSYLIENQVFSHYRTEPYCRALFHLVEKYKPEILLVGATGLGRDLAGAVATKLRTGLTADCTGLGIDESGLLLQTRPAFGGNVMATILTKHSRPQMATIRPHVMPMPNRDASCLGSIVRESVLVREEDFTTKVLEVIQHSSSSTDIDIVTADIIVSGGRGMRAKENFRILQELASELGGAVASSRSAVEAGWMSAEHQVGQTGKTVRPIIYIACGISGAIQHLVGMQESDVIVAINRDYQAPIFEVATYGILGDLFEVVPILTRQIKELRTKKMERSL